MESFLNRWLILSLLGEDDRMSLLPDITVCLSVLTDEVEPA